MADAAVVNTSPLIFLSKAGLIDLLRVIAPRIMVPEMVAIIDDGAGRRCAEVLGVPLSGTLGLVLLAKQRGMIPAARPIIATLKMHGMFLSEKTIDQALALVGE